MVDLVAYTDGDEGFRVLHDPLPKPGVLGQLLSVMFFLPVPDRSILFEF